MIHEDFLTKVSLSNKAAAESGLNIKLVITDEEELQVNPNENGELTSSFSPGDNFTVNFGSAPRLSLTLTNDNKVVEDPESEWKASVKDASCFFVYGNLVISVTVTPYPGITPPTIGIVVVGTVDVHLPQK